MGSAKSHVFVSCMLLLCLGCKKVDDLLTFTLSDRTSFTVESSTPLDLPLQIATPEVTTNSSQRFESNNTKASLVKNVHLTDLVLTISQPSGKTFSFLKSINVYISADGHDEILLAYANDISSASSTLALIPAQQKLDPYVKASSYNLRTELVIKETVTHDVTVQADLSFRVTAAPLN